MGRKSIKKSRIKNTKKRIKYTQQLRPVFYEFGLAALSMDDIAEKLNISKATLYNHFVSKEDMVAEILNYVLSEISKFEPIIDNKSLPFMERYFSSIKILSTNVTGMSNLFLSDLQEFYPDLWQMIRDFRAYAAKVLERFYEEGKKANILSGYSTNILVLSDRLFFDALSEPSVLADNNLTIEKAFKEYFKLKCFGMINIADNKELKSDALELLSSLEI